jgi:hypothetical protein
MSGSASDDELMATLAELLRRVDPPPGAVVAAASASLAWLDPDTALARLVEAQEPATVRGAAPRLLTFEVGEMSVDVEVTAEGYRVRLVGQVVPTGPATVSVQHRDGTTDVRADELGRFVVGEVASGLVRLTLTPDAAPRFRTEWFLA